MDWILFLSAALMINVAPGPDLAFVVSNTAAHGARVGFASSWGVCVGAFIHVVLAAVGVSAAMAAVPWAMEIVGWLGACYLADLGVASLSNGIWPQRREASSTQASSERLLPLQAFVRGVCVDVMNPKVAIFFISFLPQFVPEEASAKGAWILGLGAIVCAIALVWESVVVVVVSRALRPMGYDPRMQRVLDGMLGATLIALAIRLAMFASGSSA